MYVHPDHDHLQRPFVVVADGSGSPADTPQLGRCHAPEMDARVKGGVCDLLLSGHGGVAGGLATGVRLSTTVTLISVMKEGSLSSVPK